MTDGMIVKKARKLVVSVPRRQRALELSRYPDPIIWAGEADMGTLSEIRFKALGQDFLRSATDFRYYG